MNGKRTPVGIVTDRYLVVAVLAAHLNPSFMRVGGIMSPELEVASKDQGIFETMHQMRNAGIQSCGLGGWIPGENYFHRRLGTAAVGGNDRARQADSREQRREMHVRR